jgi:hypothetical protein
MRRIIFVFCLVWIVTSCRHTQAAPEPIREDIALKKADASRESYLPLLDMNIAELRRIYSAAEPLEHNFSTMRSIYDALIDVEKSEEMSLLTDVFIVYAKKYEDMYDSFMLDAKNTLDLFDRVTVEDLSTEDMVWLAYHTLRLVNEARNISGMGKPYFALAERFFLLLQKQGY